MSYANRPPSPPQPGHYATGGHGTFYTMSNPGSYPGVQAGSDPYDLADDRPPAYGTFVGVSRPSAGPAKRVRTTLGSGRRDRGRPAPPPITDPSARISAALRGVALPATMETIEQDFGISPDEMRRLRRTPTRRLRPLVAREPLAARSLFAALALLIALAYLAGLLQFWAPAAPEIDPSTHAAMLAGRQLAEQGTMRLVPADAFSPVGEGWVLAAGLPANEGPEAVEAAPAYYPKSPGLALMFAGIFRAASAVDRVDQGVAWAHATGPAAAALALLAMFYLGRFAGGSFFGALATLAMAGNLVLLRWADAPDATLIALSLASWGIVSLLWWWRCGGMWRGMIAGLVLGAAATVEYAAGLLVLPLALACVLAWQWRRPLTSLVHVLVPALAWAVPVAAMIAFNLRTIGAPSSFQAESGNAAGAFAAENVLDSWQRVAAQLGELGLFFLLPLGITGLLALCARRLALGLVVLAWCVPVALACAVYAWEAGDQPPGTLWMRPLLLVVPAVLMGMAYLMRRVLYAPGDAAPQVVLRQDPSTGETYEALAEPASGAWRGLAAPIAAGAVVAVALALGAHRAAAAEAANEPGRAADHVRAANLAELGRFAAALIPPGSVVFAEAPAADARLGVVPHLQLAGEMEIYNGTMFTARFARGLPADQAPEAEPAGRGTRLEVLRDLYAGTTDEQLSAEVRRIIDRGLDEGREVYLVMTGTDARRFAQSHLLRGYETTTFASFHDWLAVAPPQADGEPLPPPGRANEWMIVQVTREADVEPPTSRPRTRV